MPRYAHQLLTAGLAVAAAACAGRTAANPSNAPVPEAAEQTDDLRILNGPNPSVPLIGVRLIGTRAPAVEAHVRAPVASAFAALAEAYRLVGLPATRFDTAARIVGAVDVRASSRFDAATLGRYVSCGGSSYGEPSLGEYGVRLTLLSRVTTDAAGSLVSTQLFADGQRPGASGPPTPCPTTGRLEAALNRALRGLAEPDSAR